MAKVDTAIAAGGIVFLIAAAGALLWVQEFADLQDYAFDTTDAPLQERSQAITSGTAATLEWHDLPDNATAAQLDVTIAYSGRAVQGGEATVELRLEAPDGTRTTETATFTVPPVADSGSHTFPINVTWGRVPGPLRAQAGDLPSSIQAEGPLTLRVTLQGPADIPLASDLSYELVAVGSVTTYAAGAQ